MKRTKQEVRELLINFKLPRWKDLPNFDIYMDQVVSYINQQLAPLYFNEEEKIITRSMINNYVKNSIVKPPVKKHYKRYHLAFLIVVLILKRCYSLTEISKLIEIHNQMEHSDLEKSYDVFSCCFENCLHEIIREGNAGNLPIQNSNWQKQLLINVVQSVVFKMYAEIDLIKEE